MLEISGNHISRLSDEDLRTLVARLCEAELRRFGLPQSAVTAGGNQDAPDGGIDVRVDLTSESTGLDFIQRPTTGFQVKCSDMPPNAIKKEMRPRGKLRESIKELATTHGAYIIVSSKGSTADTSLQSRRMAMSAAISDFPDGAALHLDFYDRERLAHWVRAYPGIGLWIRERIGEPLSGWRGYGNWAYGDSANSEYLMDDKGRLVSKQSGSSQPMPIEQGITAMRQILGRPGGIIRLVGLSGLGKTRLVQALFDGRIGTESLDSAIVVYTDQGHEPDPSARDMLYRLSANRLRAIVVVDNCNPTTHRQLAQMLSSQESSLSLLTVEYDVADDEPEETHVFQLEPASETILIEILERLTPHVSHADRQRIAEFSGGNALIALALARTVKHHESLGVLNDKMLFERLFHQNQVRSADLVRAAEVCSLVYSFDGETLEGSAAELPVLAELAEFSPGELFRHAEEIRSRHLIQRRSRWRAVLPHAIANRLARQALQSIPTELITRAFAQEGRGHLLKSFSRRLCYLHDCEPAVKIAEGWLNDPNWLANPTGLSGLGTTLFHNIAPLAPELALQVVEAATLGENGGAFLSPNASGRWRWAALLRALAYEPELFDRSAFLLARFVAAEPEDTRHHSARGSFKELFHLYLSGTCALAEQRLNFIRKLLDSGEPKLETCALEALDAMLEAGSFSSSHDFSFGARSRGFGWQPKTQTELSDWFRSALTLAAELALKAPFHQQQVRASVARNFRTIWTQAEVPDDLERFARQQAAHDGWPGGWIAVRTTLRYDVNDMSPELVQRLHRLEAELQPRDLIQKIKTYVLSPSHADLEMAESEAEDDGGPDVQAGFERVNQIVEELGREAAATPDILMRLLPELLRHGPGQNWQFGRGLALGVSDPLSLWELFSSELAALPAKERSVSLVQGFIAATMSRDPCIANRLLDQSVSDPVLGPYFPLLQGAMTIDDIGAERLAASLTVGLAQASTYGQLAYGGVANAIPSPVYKRIVLRVAELPDGFSVAISLLVMRLHGLKGNKLDVDQETLSLGRDLLNHLDFKVPSTSFIASNISEIAKVCLQGTGAYDVALNLCSKFSRALSDYGTGAREYSKLAGTLFHLQPQAALDTLLGERDKGGGATPLSRLLSIHNDRESPVNRVPPDGLLTWADQDAADRYPKLANEIRLFERCGDPSELEWTHLALQVLEQAPDRSSILEIFSSRLQPTVWSGSFADTLSPYLSVVRKLANHSDPMVAAWTRQEEDRLARRIEEERRRERRVDESFE